MSSARPGGGRVRRVGLIGHCDLGVSMALCRDKQLVKTSVRRDLGHELSHFRHDHFSVDLDSVESPRARRTTPTGRAMMAT